MVRMGTLKVSIFFLVLSSHTLIVLNSTDCTYIIIKKKKCYFIIITLKVTDEQMCVVII